MHDPPQNRHRLMQSQLDEEKEHNVDSAKKEMAENLTWLKSILAHLQGGSKTAATTLNWHNFFILRHIFSDSSQLFFLTIREGRSQFANPEGSQEKV